SAVAQLVDCEPIADAGPHRGDQKLDLIVREDLIQTRFLDVEDLASKGQDSLEDAIASLLGRATRTGASITLPRAVRWGKSWKSWKIMPSWRRTAVVVAVVRPPSAGSSVCGPTRIVPRSKAHSPLRQRSSVDLPPPLGPISATVSPTRTC